jgi:hypothetical protein
MQKEIIFSFLKILKKENLSKFNKFDAFSKYFDPVRINFAYLD